MRGRYEKRVNWWPCIYGLLIIAFPANGLRLTNLNVPSVIRQGEDAWLNCSYSLEPHERLYSVKWYKGSWEISSYIPETTNKPSTAPANEKGVYIDAHRSTQTDLYLMKTDFQSEGRYQCEVSIDLPFTTVKAHKYMTVYEEPIGGPVIAGHKDKYGVGELVNVTCLYGPSRPLVSLEWKVNDATAGTRLGQSIVDRIVPHSGNTTSLARTLSFRLKGSHFIGPSESLRLKCIATLNIPYNVSSEEVVLARKKDHDRSPTTYTFHKAGPKMDGPTVEQSPRRQTYPANEKLNLNCRAIGDEPVEVNWLKGDDRVDHRYVQKPVEPFEKILTFRVNETLFNSKAEVRFRCIASYIFHRESMHTIEIPQDGPHSASGLTGASVTLASSSFYLMTLSVLLATSILISNRLHLKDYTLTHPSLGCTKTQGLQN